jgi:hypothetical protein
MIIPKKVRCKFSHEGYSPPRPEDFICEVDENGWCRCGDAIVELDEPTMYCSWVEKVLAWQEIKTLDI